MSSSNSSSSGVSVLGLLGVAFVVLKLTNVIDWSWWWVTAPFWGGIAIVILLLAIYGLILLIAKKSKPTIPTIRKSKFQKKLEQMQRDREACR